MRRYALTLTFGLLFLVVSTTAAKEDPPPQDTQLTVAEAVITTAIMDRQPTDNATNVSSSVGQVYCWTRIAGAEGEIEVYHVWYWGDQEMARVPLRVAGTNWRTWSSKRIEPSWTGDWRVDVVGPDGTVLDSVSFTVS
jgi:hypothetical protein